MISEVMMIVIPDIDWMAIKRNGAFEGAADWQRSGRLSSEWRVRMFVVVVQISDLYSKTLMFMASNNSLMQRNNASGHCGANVHSLKTLYHQELNRLKIDKFRPGLLATIDCTEEAYQQI